LVPDRCEDLRACDPHISADLVNITTRIISGVLLVVLEGEIDRSHNAALRDAVLSPLLEPFPIRSVLVDLSHCRYLDGAALSVFLTAATMIPDDSWFAFVGPSQAIRRLLQVVGLENGSRVRICESRRAGMAFLRGEIVPAD
jgi:anti-anti-sigma factor